VPFACQMLRGLAGNRKASAADPEKLVHRSVAGQCRNRCWKPKLPKVRPPTI
jgi:hypothetical protein